MPPKRAPQINAIDKMKLLCARLEKNKRISTELELKLATNTAKRIVLLIISRIRRRMELPAQMDAVPDYASDSGHIPRANARKRLRPSRVDDNTIIRTIIRPVVPSTAASVSASQEIIPPSEFRVYNAIFNALDDHLLGRKSIHELYQVLASLFANHSDLLHEFNDLLQRIRKLLPDVTNSSTDSSHKP